MAQYINLGISPESTPDWGIQQALRELWQNYFDNEEESSHKYENGKLFMRNNNTVLDKSVLLVGKSLKRDDPKLRGKHGDGLCSSLAVLTREGRVHSIVNGNDLWVAESYYCDDFKDDIIRVKVTDFGEGDYFEIEIEITEEEYADTVSRCIQLQPNLKTFPTSSGDILLDDHMKGCVYVGGMFVCIDTALSKGYNFNPNELKLDRDRSLARTWDIIAITDTMLAEMSQDKEHEDTVVDMIEKGCQDTQHLAWHTNSVSDSVVDKLHENFVDKHGEDAIVAEDFEEATQLRNSGYKKVIYTGNSVSAKLIKKSSKYQPIQGDIVVKNCSDYLQEFQDKYYDDMSTDMLNDFEDMTRILNDL